MEEVSTRVLARLEPKGVATDGEGRQRRKSAGMRVVILDATIACIQRHGYARTTVQLITETAGVSRGAMLHHFPTKSKLMTAVIEYAFYRHMSDFLGRLAQGSLDDALLVSTIAEQYWASVQSREYFVYVELGIAARTDPDLQATFSKAAAHIDRVWGEEMVLAFPEWAGQASKMLLANDLTVALFIGLLFNSSIWAQPRVDEVRKISARVIEMLRNGAL